MRDERLQRVRRVRRLGVAPELLDEPTVGHRVRCGQREQREHRLQLGPGDRDHLVADAHLGWSQQCNADRAVHSRPSPQWVPQSSRLLRGPRRRIGHTPSARHQPAGDDGPWGRSRRAGKRRPCRPTSRRSRAIAWASPPSSPAAPDASRLLATAIALDPGFALARAASAVALALEGRPYEPLPRGACAINRAERQHLEVVQATLSGSVRRARDLRREHLLEFPGDVLIVWLPVVQHEMRPGVTIDPM